MILNNHNPTSYKQTHRKTLNYRRICILMQLNPALLKVNLYLHWYEL